MGLKKPKRALCQDSRKNPGSKELQREELQSEELQRQSFKERNFKERNFKEQNFKEQNFKEHLGLLNNAPILWPMAI